MASLLAAWNRQTQSFLPLAVLLLSNGSFFLLVHISFLVSTNFLTLFSLFLSIEFSHFVHSSLFSCLILTVFRAVTSCSWKSLFCMMRPCVCAHIQNQQILHYQGLSRGIWWYGNLFSTALNISAVTVVCGSSGKDWESEVEEGRRDGKDRERRMWKAASQMASCLAFRCEGRSIIHVANES